MPVLLPCLAKILRTGIMLGFLTIPPLSTHAQDATGDLATAAGEPPPAATSGPSPRADFGPRPAKPADLTNYLTGNAADKDVAPVNGPGVLLMGGNFDVESAFTQRVYPIIQGGDVLVLRASGSDGYNDFLYNLTSGPLRPDSVESIIVNSVAKANTDYVYWACRSAEFIYFAGGDQSDYVNYYAGTKVEQGLKEMYARGGVIGGISAGLAVMGQFIYDPDGVSAVTSTQAIANPYRSSMILTDGFLNGPEMADILTDSHFADRNRMGRLMGFMARLRQDGRADRIFGVGVSEDTSMFVDRNRVGIVDGAKTVFVLREDFATTRDQVAAGAPLVYGKTLRTRLVAGQKFDFANITTTGITLRLSVDGHNATPHTPANPYTEPAGTLRPDGIAYYWTNAR